MKKRGDGWYKRKRPGGGTYPEWRHRYTNEFGKKDEFVGYTDKSLSRSAFNREIDRVKEEVHRRRLGLPSTSDSPIKEIAKEYVAWGKREGGKGGRPWAVKHAENIERSLLGTPNIEGMISRMGLKRLSDFSRVTFENCLSAWENPKTRGLVGGAVKSFFGWLVLNQLLSDNPLAKWPGRKMESDGQVRDLTLDEFERILAVAPKKRALAYEFASYTGARASEFNAITLDSVKWDRGGVYLPRKATKARKEHFFFLPGDFLSRLAEHTRYRLPGALLFNLSREHKDRYFHQDREAAGIPYMTDEGKCTLHSLRHLFETELGFASTDSATELDMGRHTDMRTRKRYLHSRDEAKRKTIENMAARRAKSGTNNPLQSMN